MNKESENNINNEIHIFDRQNISISGVTRIQNFDSDEFVLETVLGELGIKGNGLEIIKLDTYEGTIVIKGFINSFVYFDETKRKKENSVITRLFK